jgi:hypothetical protein
MKPIPPIRAHAPAVFRRWRGRRLLDLPPGFAKAFKRCRRARGAQLRPATRPAAGSPCGRHRQRRMRPDGGARADPARLHRRGLSGRPGTATSTQDRFKGFWKRFRGIRAFRCVSYAQGLFLRCRPGGDACALLVRQAGQAYFCGDDVLSIGALSAIRHAGLKVPGDIGIIGLNDMEMAGWENINLTTIRQPISRSSIPRRADCLDARRIRSAIPKPGCFLAR